jgi:hypothetical protein
LSEQPGLCDANKSDGISIGRDKSRPNGDANKSCQSRKSRKSWFRQPPQAFFPYKNFFHSTSKKYLAEKNQYKFFLAQKKFFSSQKFF